MAESVHRVQVTLNMQQVVQRQFFIQNVRQEKLFGEMFAMGLEGVNTSDDKRNQIVIVVENLIYI